MIFFITYLIEFPFWQGYAVFCWCLVILLLHFMYVRSEIHQLHRMSHNPLLFHSYRPYKNRFRQMLASVCVVSLMSLCALLLRTQSLLSSSRSANFDPNDPSNDSNTFSPDLQGVITLTLLCLTFPLLATIFLYVFVNSAALQRRWNAVAEAFAKLHITVAQNKITPPRSFSLESPRIAQAFRSQISASRALTPLSVSPFSPSNLTLQSDAPFRRPEARAREHLAASNRLASTSAIHVSPHDVSIGGSLRYSSPLQSIHWDAAPPFATTIAAAAPARPTAPVPRATDSSSRSRAPTKQECLRARV
jgi:hypothetical protein